MGAEVDGDHVRIDALKRNDLPSEGSSDLARLIAPMDSSAWVGAFKFAIG